MTRLRLLLAAQLMAAAGGAGGAAEAQPASGSSGGPPQASFPQASFPQTPAPQATGSQPAAPPATTAPPPGPPARSFSGPAVPQSSRAPTSAPPRAPVPATAGVALRPYQRPQFHEEGPARVRRRRVVDTRYRHDGFYFRFGGGLGAGLFYAEASNTDRYRFSGGDDSSEAKIKGVAGATEVALGWTASGGAVMGGGIYTMLLWRGKAKTEGPRYEFYPSQLALFAPFVDYYLWQDRGIHVQGAFGLGTVVLGTGGPTEPTTREENPPVQAHTALGYGLMLGAGYEWFVAEQWSLGGLARMVRAFCDGTDPDGIAWAHDSIAYSVLITATYH